LIFSLNVGNFVIDIDQEGDHLSIDTFIKGQDKSLISSGWIIHKKEKISKVKLNSHIIGDK